jgi:hypothetical protein
LELNKPEGILAMNIISIDYEKGVVRSDFLQWRIVSNNYNKFLLLEREENGRYHAAEADVQKKQMFEVKEITYKGPNGEVFALDPDSGIVRIC